jgi:hypothetical protein
MVGPYFGMIDMFSASMFLSVCVCNLVDLPFHSYCGETCNTYLLASICKDDSHDVQGSFPETTCSAFGYRSYSQNHLYRYAACCVSEAWIGSDWLQQAA